MRTFDYTFKVGDKEYTLTYTFKVRREFERRTKMSVTGLLSRVANAQEQKADDLIVLLKLLLSTHHPEMIEDGKDDKIEQLVDDLGGEDRMMQIITEALGVQSPGEGGVPNP